MDSEGEGTKTNQDVRQLAGVEGIEDTCEMPSFAEIATFREKIKTTT